MQVGALELLVTLWQTYPSEMLEIHGGGGLGGGAEGTPYSIYLLYWYKSTNTDAAGGGGLSGGRRVHALNPTLCSVYLLYWYKSTNMAAGGGGIGRGAEGGLYALFSSVALLVQKHKY
jgi:hypothetical protein